MLRKLGDKGSAPVEVTFSIVVLILLVLGVIQLGLTLYARNVVLSAAHDGARAAVELNRDPSEASRIARTLVERAVGGVVSELEVVTVTTRAGDRAITRVSVGGALAVPGPVPVEIPLRAAATASREDEVE